MKPTGRTDVRVGRRKEVEKGERKGERKDIKKRGREEKEASLPSSFPFSVAHFLLPLRPFVIRRLHV